MKIEKFTKGLIVLTAVAFVAMTTAACSQDLVEEITEEDRTQAKSDLENARLAFESLVQSVNSDTGTEVDYDDEETWGPEAEIKAAAMTAYYTGDDTEFKEVASRYGILDDFYRIAEDYDVASASRVVSTRSSSSRAVTSSLFTSGVLKEGDILLCGGLGEDANSVAYFFNFAVSGNWKHSGLYDADAEDPNYVVFTASDSTDTYAGKTDSTSSGSSASSSNASSGNGVGAVGYESIAKWVENPYVKVDRVSDVTTAQAKKALTYIKQFSGCPYSLTVTRGTDKKWYCSKVCFRAYDYIGKDIEYHTSSYAKGYWVTPTDLDDDDDTYYVAGDESY